MAIAGVGFSTNYVMPFAIIPDTVELDYAEHGIRREGVFYGLWNFINQLGVAFALALNGWVLGWFGYVPNVAQDVPCRSWGSGSWSARSPRCSS